MKFRAPKTIVQHPAVESVVAGEDQGSDYKYWVFLKPGKFFQHGHAEGCSGGAGFNTVARFLYEIGKEK